MSWNNWGQSTSNNDRPDFTPGLHKAKLTGISSYMAGEPNDKGYPEFPDDSLGGLVMSFSTDYGTMRYKVPFMGYDDKVGGGNLSYSVYLWWVMDSVFENLSDYVRKNPLPDFTLPYDMGEYFSKIISQAKEVDVLMVKNKKGYPMIYTYWAIPVSEKQATLTDGEFVYNVTEYKGKDYLNIGMSLQDVVQTGEVVTVKDTDYNVINPADAMIAGRKVDSIIPFFNNAVCESVNFPTWTKEGTVSKPSLLVRYMVKDTLRGYVVPF